MAAAEPPPAAPGARATASPAPAAARPAAPGWRPPAHASRFDAYDLLASMVAVLGRDGRIRFANTAFEGAAGLSRRTLEGAVLADLLAEPAVLSQALHSVCHNAFSTLRFDAALACPPAEPLPVHVIVAQPERADEIVVELIALDAQIRHEREARQHGLGAANKELVRNLAHEIKNPLGGIRGAAQLLEMELGEAGLREYTQVIIHEADRLQVLVDRLLAPHRQPHMVGSVNIHEVCERVRALIVAEFPRGLIVERDYDTSLPDIRGDRQQLIQALLNIAHNAAQALRARMAQGDARLVLRTRVGRQLTIGKQRHKLALQLLVIDNGPGVPDEIQERVFFPLVSGRDGGSGLGLTLAQTFIEQHQGSIELDSQPGHTEFRILIPLP